MTPLPIVVFNAAQFQALLATRLSKCPVAIRHACFALPWKDIADRRAGILHGRNPDLSEVRESLSDARIVFGLGLPWGLTDLAPDLEWVESPSVGCDQLRGTGVLEVESNVKVTTVGGLYAGAVAEHVLALLLGLTRKLPRFLAAQARGAWEPETVGELTGQTMAIVGLGRIGRRVADIARHFGMRVVGVRRTPDAGVDAVERVVGPECLAEILPEADVVVVTVAGTPETAQLIGRPELEMMKEGALVINVSRGIVIDEEALADCLDRGHLGGAGLDVFTKEPLPVDSRLRRRDNVILTPHVAIHTPRRMERAVGHFADNVMRYCAGKPLQDCLDRARGY